MDQEKAFEMWDKALWDVYEYDGCALADLLNDWTETSIFSASRYGERVYVVIDDYPIEIFSRWDLWRQEMSYYATSFANALAENPTQPSNNELEAARDVLAYHVLGATGIKRMLEDNHGITITLKGLTHEMAEKYFFM